MSDNMPIVKVTTASGHSWTTNVAAQVTEAEAKRYFMGARVDISSDPYTEKMDVVVKVEFTPAPQPIAVAVTYGCDNCGGEVDTDEVLCKPCKEKFRR
jgi:hypothetical protein